MSLVDLTMPVVLGFGTAAMRSGSHNRVTMDASGERAAIIFRAKTGTITKIGWRTYTVTASDSIKVSLQSVDAATGYPSGTILGGGAAYGIQSSVAANTNYFTQINGSSGQSVTHGDWIAIVWEFTSYVSGNLQIWMVLPAGFEVGIPYYMSDVGGAGWALSNGVPSVTVLYSDGPAQIPGLVPAGNCSSFMVWNSGENPDRRGLRFKNPFKSRMIGVAVGIDTDGDQSIIIYSAAATVHETISVDKDIRNSGVFCSFWLLSTPLTLEADTYYRIVILPTTATNAGMSIHQNLGNDGTYFSIEACAGGKDYHYTYCNGAPANEGSWTNDDTNYAYRPSIFPIIDQIDIGGGGIWMPAARQIGV